MKISIKTLKIAKTSVFSIACLVLTVVSPSLAHAEQSAKTSLFNANNLFQSCASSNTGNTYCWNKDFATTTTSNVAQQLSAKTHHVTTSIGQRIAAITLSLIVEYTTAQSFNDIELN